MGERRTGSKGLNGGWEREAGGKEEGDLKGRESKAGCTAKMKEKQVVSEKEGDT